MAASCLEEVRPRELARPPDETSDSVESRGSCILLLFLFLVPLLWTVINDAAWWQIIIVIVFVVVGFIVVVVAVVVVALIATIATPKNRLCFLDRVMEDADGQLGGVMKEELLGRRRKKRRKRG